MWNLPEQSPRDYKIKYEKKKKSSTGLKTMSSALFMSYAGCFSKWLEGVEQNSVKCSFYVRLGISLVNDSSSLVLSPSPNWVWVWAPSFSTSVTCLAFRKLGWLVDARSLAHILSVITTLFCLSVIRCI